MGYGQAYRTDPYARTDDAGGNPFAEVQTDGKNGENKHRPKVYS